MDVLKFDLTRSTPSSWDKSITSSSRRTQSPCASGHPEKGASIRPAISQAVTNHRWLLSQPGVATTELMGIESRAKETWCNDLSLDKRKVTSYGAHYSPKVLDERTKSRPTSPTRKNKPHPPQIFMTTRLHYVHGFHNSDTSLAQQAYKVDASVSQEEKMRRQSAREKYQASQKPAALSTQDRQMIENSLSSRERESMPLDTDFSKISQNSLENEQSKDKGNLLKRFDRPLIGSLHRFNRYVGPMEMEHWHIGTDSHNFLPQSGESTARSESAPSCYEKHHKGVYHRYYGFYGDMKEPLPYLQQRKLIYQPKTVRGDYSIHPQWPATLKHHRIPIPVEL